MGLSKILIMLFFLKLNFRYDNIFLGKGTLKENKKIETVALKRIFQVSKSSATWCSALLISGPMQKSITRNTISQNFNSAVPRNLGVPRY